MRYVGAFNEKSPFLLTPGMLLSVQEEDFEFDDGVYAELGLENFVEADLDEEETVDSDMDADGSSTNTINFAHFVHHLTDPPPRPSLRKITKTEEDDSKEDVSASSSPPNTGSQIPSP